MSAGTARLNRECTNCVLSGGDNVCPVRRTAIGDLEYLDEFSRLPTLQRERILMRMSVIAAVGQVVPIFIDRKSTTNALWATEQGECDGPKVERRWSFVLPIAGVRVSFGPKVTRCQNEAVPKDWRIPVVDPIVLVTSADNAELDQHSAGVALGGDVAQEVTA